MYRRELLKTLAAGAASITLARQSWAAASRPKGQSNNLIVSKRTIEVMGRSASVFGLKQDNGRSGLVLDAEDGFNVLLSNTTDEATLIHWHGLTPPWEMDGVPDNPTALLGAGEQRQYDFALQSGGTHWMHAHTLQEQRLLAAPLIVKTAEDRARDEQDVVILLHDFSFKSPEELLAELQQGPLHGGEGAGGQMAMDHGSMMSNMEKMHGADTPVTSMPMMDLNDIEYDAYLANDRTLDDPEVVRVEKGGRVRLRIINGATATAFTADTGSIVGHLAAVDGIACEPVTGTRFPISMGQRLDIILQLPPGIGTYPILALREGSEAQTGVILATADASVSKIATAAAKPGPVLDLSLEQLLQATSPLADRAANKSYILTLTGNMAGYTWSINGDEMAVDPNDRVRLTMRNMSMMAHPMHLHGHHFQVVSINGKSIRGAVRDTVHVSPMAEVAIEFEANNAGRWPFHCHHLYHMAAGMMSFVSYNRAI
ncbi:MAG: multicopper oxidase family protein [Alphaproteobacteria bacterium]|nr:multicopper oxidase family protein [Alphaproteobacteria bacterium]MBU1548777.1 multicopper oxidase family protein [Alphaproteobacteria bacterium]MBU2335603.1 multicopper oxidase family protein [Alphaproteobacteria bacterium]MBU2391002.1 multicopper oxidase family protein [Alphaproteobacteria bacterium]